MFNRPSLEIVCYKRRSNPWHHTPKLWLRCWNTQDSTTPAPKTRIRFTFDLELSFFEAFVQFLFQEFKQPRHKCLLLDMPLFKLLSFFGFDFCAFLFDLVLLFWILCFLGFRFCAKSNLWFGLVIFTCFCGYFSFDFVFFYYFYEIRFNGDTYFNK